MNLLWDKFNKTSLISGAWYAVKWEDLPSYIQDEFINFVSFAKGEQG